MTKDATVSTYNIHYRGDERGVRMLWSSERGTPNPDVTGTLVAPAWEIGGEPVYIASAINFEGGVHPCKITFHHGESHCRVSYGGDEVAHHGDYELLRFDPEWMEWVPVRQPGQLPPGRRAISGGYEDGNPLYHALLEILDEGTGRKVWVPGKAGPHLGGACACYGGEQSSSTYQILCWR